MELAVCTRLLFLGFSNTNREKEREPRLNDGIISCFGRTNNLSGMLRGTAEAKATAALQ
jgi:hypothetical protein